MTGRQSSPNLAPALHDSSINKGLCLRSSLELLVRRLLVELTLIDLHKGKPKGDIEEQQAALSDKNSNTSVACDKSVHEHRDGPDDRVRQNWKDADGGQHVGDDGIDDGDADHGNQENEIEDDRKPEHDGLRDIEDLGEKHELADRLKLLALRKQEQADNQRPSGTATAEVAVAVKERLIEDRALCRTSDHSRLDRSLDAGGLNAQCEKETADD